MPIAGAREPEFSVTEGWRALELFTDRHEETLRFLRYLNEDVTPRRVLFLYGDGGNGKSLLLRHLMESCCKRFDPENWEWLSRLDGDELVANVAHAEGAHHLPVAALNFALPGQGENRPQEPFSALLMLRRALPSREFIFPLFDFACVWYLHRTGGLTGERIKFLFPPQVSSLIGGFVSIITSSLPLPRVVGDLIKLVNKHFGEEVTVQRTKKMLNESDIQAIIRLDPHSELIQRLPVLFGRDINAAMSRPKAPSRVVFLFDQAVRGPRRLDDHDYDDRGHEPARHRERRRSRGSPVSDGGPDFSSPSALAKVGVDESFDLHVDWDLFAKTRISVRFADPPE